jgi:uncharacterized phage protein (TIGR01671 family)
MGDQMNDRYKFRAWDTDSKEMVANENLAMIAGEPAYIVEGEYTPFIVDSLIPMQWTGLTYKNGVKIFCSDIIRDHVGVGVVKYSDKHGAFRVSYGGGVAKWFIDYNLRGEIESIEKIGDIYTAPELMEE